jgi:hypothetical protein
MSEDNGMTANVNWTTSPLTASLERFGQRNEHAEIVRGQPEPRETPWFGVAEFAATPIADQVISRIAEKYEATVGVAGTYIFRCSLSVPLGLAGYLFASERRVPVLGDNLLYNDCDWLNHIALLAPRAIVLAGDELAGAAGVETVADERSLQAALFQQAASLVDPLVTAWGPRKLVNRTNAWASALDYLAYGFQLAGRHELGLDAAWAEFQQVCAERSFPTRRRPQRFQYEVDGEADEMVVRAGCCLWYMLPQMRNSEHRYCTSCYLESDESRLEKLTAWKRRLAADKQAA